MSQRIIVRRTSAPLVFVLTETHHARNRGIIDVADPERVVPDPEAGWYDRYELQELTTGSRIEFVVDPYAIDTAHDKDELLLNVIAIFTRKLEAEVQDHLLRRALNVVEGSIDRGASLASVDHEFVEAMHRRGIDVTNAVIIVERNDQ